MPEAPVISDPIEWLAAPGQHPFLVLDVFTPRPLEGNQLGVFVDGRPFSSELMQRLARELNFAETVFLLPPRSGGDVHVRIFTPASELPFAGHPVLGTAFVAGQALAKDSVVLETGRGPVPVELQRTNGRIDFGRMQQPIPSHEPAPRQAELLEALGIPGSELPIERYRNGPEFTYVALASVDAVAALRPDFQRLNDLDVAVYCFAGEGRSWKARMFYPAAGVAEDPATGSAAGPLAVHLARHGRIAFGDEIEVRQGEEIGRPSLLYVRATGSAQRIESVEVGGSAQIVASGRFALDQT